MTVNTISPELTDQGGGSRGEGVGQCCDSSGRGSPRVEKVGAIRNERGPGLREVLLGGGHEDDTGGADATGENGVGIT